LVYREEEREMIPLCLDMKVGLIPWSPLARGFLCGSRQAQDRQKADAEENEKQPKVDSSRAKTDAFAHSLYYQSADFDVVRAVEEVASRYGVKPAQIALAWVLAKPGVNSPIIGATKMSVTALTVSGGRIRGTRRRKAHGDMGAVLCCGAVSQVSVG
jgi:aryl-alcohol dehydrogenase-like predicted oxidoreductase